LELLEKASPGWLQRIWAEAVRRGVIILIAFIILLFPSPIVGSKATFYLWFCLVMALSLFNDTTSRRRGAGKKRSKLLVVSGDGRAPCPRLKAIARRIGPTLSLAAYCLSLTIWPSFPELSQAAQNVAEMLISPLSRFYRTTNLARDLMLFALARDLLSVMLMRLSDSGRRLGDVIANTTVVRESAFSQLLSRCIACGKTIVLLRTWTACPHCGSKHYDEPPIIRYQAAD
jgi:uncharacterized RDD family membrane protein YckC